MAIKGNLLYVGHEYHKKTHSVDFLLDIFREKYNVDYMTYNSETDSINEIDQPCDKKYDVLVLFQMPVSPDLLKHYFRFKHAAYFPMYDGTGEAPDLFWLQYTDFNIINFSLTLHKRLIEMGISSYYIQFFPPVSEKIIEGENDSLFMWQRRELLNINVVEKLFDKHPIHNIHIHKAMDPGEMFTEPTDSQKEKYNITFSEWYENKRDMLEDVKKAALYLAPREYEGIGMSFLEAMAMGKCVIAPDHPTMNEYIKDGETGFLYDVRNPKNLSIKNVKEIQQNTYAYMKAGYDKWERDKYQILEWLESKVHTDPKRLEKTYKEKYIVRKYYLHRFLLMTTEINDVHRLFGRIVINHRIISFLRRLKYGKGEVK